MFRLILFNKPMNVLTRFTDDQGRDNLSAYIDLPEVYPIGRLDLDSEGLLVLSDRASLVAPLTKPGNKEKRYLVCVEGIPSSEQLALLSSGPRLKDGPCLPAQVEHLPGPPDWLWPREPPIRFRKTVPVSWLEVAVREGRNRQVRRMTASVGLPTLRLVRLTFGPFELGDLAPGQWREASPSERRAALELEDKDGSSPPGRRPRRGTKGRGTRSSGPSSKRRP